MPPSWVLRLNLNCFFSLTWPEVTSWANGIKVNTDPKWTVNTKQLKSDVRFVLSLSSRALYQISQSSGQRACLPNLLPLGVIPPRAAEQVETTSQSPLHTTPSFHMSPSLGSKDMSSSLTSIPFLALFFPLLRRKKRSYIYHTLCPEHDMVTGMSIPPGFPEAL